MTTTEVREVVTWYLGGRPITTTIIDRFLLDRMMKLATAFDFQQLSTSTPYDTIAGQGYVSIPTLFTVQSVRDDGSNTAITLKSIDWLKDRDRSDTGTPEYAVHYGALLQLVPTPDAVYTLNIRGTRYPALPADPATTIADLSVEWHMILAKYTAADILFGLGEDQRAMTVKNEALADISAMQEVRTIERRGQTGQISIERY